MGLKKNLTQDINPNDEYKKHILDKQNYKSGGSGIKLSLLEQIKHTDMCIKRLKTNILDRKTAKHSPRRSTRVHDGPVLDRRACRASPTVPDRLAESCA